VKAFCEEWTSYAIGVFKSWSLKTLHGMHAPSMLYNVVGFRALVGPLAASIARGCAGECVLMRA